MEQNRKNLSLSFQQPSSRRISILTRGHLTPEHVQLSELKDYHSDGYLQDRLERLFESTCGRDYGGIFYRLVFRTDHAINLQSLGFWGPYEDSTADYHVKIIISKLSTLIVAKQKMTVLSKFEVTAPAKKKEIFFIHLPKPVTVERSSWTQIEFQLDGPVTAQSQETYKDMEVDGDDGVHFSITTTTHQLPVIKYQLV